MLVCSDSSTPPTPPRKLRICLPTFRFAFVVRLRRRPAMVIGKYRPVRYGYRLANMGIWEVTAPAALGFGKIRR